MVDLEICSDTLNEIVCTTDPLVAFKDADVAFLVGGFPRRPGMVRKDLIQINTKIFCNECSKGRYQPQEQIPSTNCLTCPFGFSQNISGQAFCADNQELKPEDCKSTALILKQLLHHRMSFLNPFLSTSVTRSLL